MEQRFFDYFRAISGTLMAAFRLPPRRIRPVGSPAATNNVIPLHRPVEFDAPDLRRYLRRHAD